MINVKSTILKEESQYSIENMKEVASEFNDKHITIEPRAESLGSVVGIITDSYYSDGEGIVVEGEIYDEERMPIVANQKIAPTMVVDSHNEIVDADCVFFTPFADDCVGQTDVLP